MMFKHNQAHKLTKNLSIAIALTLLAGFNASTLAQSGGNNDGYQSNEKSDIFGDTPSGLNPLDLMHRAQQLNGRSAAEFNADSQGQLDNSVSDFKRLQQQRILEQQQQLEINPATPATSETDDS
ncbi:MAG: hypothetical protein QNJ72_16260 [Pleurocapsa sp. MO_226.B13]|nr:hypothetical protein [Pleurocapsa sp. MO_226.B13]